MLFHLFLAFFLVALAGAAPTDVLGMNKVCGFADRGGSESYYTYFALDECHALGNATPVRNLYRDPDCDCTFYRYLCLQEQWMLRAHMWQRRKL